MAAPIVPNGVNAQGNVKVAFVETLANPASPTATEVNAGTSVDLSGFLYEGGWQPAVSGNKVSAPRRLLSRKVYEKFGITTESLGDLQYAVDPQAAAGSNGKKAYAALVEGTVGYMVERLGLDAESVDFAASQFVNVYPVVLGPQLISGDTADEAAEFKVTQGIGITGQSHQDVALAFV